MFYVWVTLLVIINASFLVLNFFALPGNWFMIALTGLFAWWQSDNSPFSIYVFIIAVLLAVAGEVVEFIAGPGGARKAGASIKGAIGAIVGTIVGAMAGTVIIPIPLTPLAISLAIKMRVQILWAFLVAPITPLPLFDKRCSIKLRWCA